MPAVDMVAHVMTDAAEVGERVLLAGTVLPGPAMAPPYASDARCVMWASAHNEDREVASSGGLPFQLRADDGRELAVETAGATAVVPLRMRFTFGRESTVVTPQGARVKRRDEESRQVGWLAAGDRVTVAGHLTAAGAPFRGRQVLVAVSVRIEGSGAATLTVPALEAAEPEF